MLLSRTIKRITAPNSIFPFQFNFDVFKTNHLELNVSLEKQIVPLSSLILPQLSPLQCSCLENPRDRGAWWAAIYGVAQSQSDTTEMTQLTQSKALAQSIKQMFFWNSLAFLMIKNDQGKFYTQNNMDFVHFEKQRCHII